jgi:hypothetical protein
MEQSMNNISENSLFFEKIMEHRFIADIMMLGWYKYGVEIKVLYSEIDSSGYDVIFKKDNIIRSVQLKASAKKSKVPSLKINTLIIKEENPCIILIKYEFNDNKLDFDLDYYFWGKEIGKALPNIDDYKIAKKTTANSNGIKRERPNIRVIPKNEFREISLNELFSILFNVKSPVSDISVGYTHYTIPINKLITENNLKIITKEDIIKMKLKRNERNDLELLCNLGKNDLMGKYYDMDGNIYYLNGTHLNQFTLKIEYFSKIYKKQN